MLGRGDPGAGLAWPLSENSAPVSERQRSDVWGLGLGWASLGTVLSSEWASLALPGVSAEVRLLVCSLPGPVLSAHTEDLRDAPSSWQPSLSPAAPRGPRSSCQLQTNIW